MDLDRRYAQLMDELVSNPGYIDGRRRFPRTFTPYDALVVTGAIHGEVDRGCEARAGSARARGLTIACVEGCNHCCEQPVVVFLPEAIRIAEWLKLPANAAARRAFLDAYPAWRERAGDGFERITHATGDEQLAAHLAQWQKKVMCAFNHGGRCVVYAVRPLVCRNCHALDTNERCKAENYHGELPTPARHGPLEAYVGEAQRLDRAMHHALGGERNRKRALCQAVYELLGDDRLAAKAPAP
jgi:hypothetical protein